MTRVPKPRKPLPRQQKPIRRRNPKRHAREWKRAYHSPERVVFVNQMPCASCGRTGFTENAHIKTGGTSRKSDYTEIIPLCASWAPKFSCHGRLHQHGPEDLELWGGINLENEADKTQKAWLVEQGERTE